jgi:hypothetical protein
MRRNSDSLQVHGVSLPENVLTQLSALGIYAQPALKKMRQPRRDRIVLIGEESGGAALVRNENMPMDVGRYITFADESGRPLPRIKLTESLCGSGRHASVLAPLLVRIEIYRVKQICQLLVTRHEVEQSKPYRVRNSIVFRGLDGTVDLERLRAGRTSHSSVLPKFLSEALDSELEIPLTLRAAIAAATVGSVCVRCSHSHFTTDALLEDSSEHTSVAGSVSPTDGKPPSSTSLEQPTPAPPEVDREVVVLSETKMGEPWEACDVESNEV